MKISFFAAVNRLLAIWIGASERMEIVKEIEEDIHHHYAEHYFRRPDKHLSVTLVEALKQYARADYCSQQRCHV